MYVFGFLGAFAKSLAKLQAKTSILVTSVHGPWQGRLLRRSGAGGKQQAIEWNPADIFYLLEKRIGKWQGKVGLHGVGERKNTISVQHNIISVQHSCVMGK